MTRKVPYYDCQYCLILLLYKGQRNSLVAIFKIDFEVTFIPLSYYHICQYSSIDKYDSYISGVQIRWHASHFIKTRGLIQGVITIIWSKKIFLSLRS